jgi:hypothetical protein
MFGKTEVTQRAAENQEKHPLSLKIEVTIEKLQFFGLGRSFVGSA